MTSQVKDFKSGDQVRLKSGGPDMTVSHVSELGDGEIRCHWFGGKKLEWGQFHPGELVKVEAEERPPSTPRPAKA